MQSEIYRRIFPETILDKKAVDYVRTTKEGCSLRDVGWQRYHRVRCRRHYCRRSNAARRCSIRACQRAPSADWVFNSVLTRFNDAAKGALILVMHRLAPDDLSATLEPDADFVLKLPLIAEKEEKYVRHGRFTMYRRPGDVLNPAAMTASSRKAQGEPAALRLGRTVSAASDGRRLGHAFGRAVSAVRPFKAAEVRTEHPFLGRRGDDRRQRERMYEVGTGPE